MKYVNETFKASKIKDTRVIEEKTEFIELEKDIQIYMWKKLTDNREIYNITFIDKNEFLDFAKELIENQEESDSLSWGSKERPNAKD